MHQIVILCILLLMLASFAHTKLISDAIVDELIEDLQVSSQIPENNVLNHRKTNEAGIKLLKKFIGFTKCYSTTDKGNPYIGYNHFIQDHIKFSEDSCIDEKTASDLLIQDLFDVETCVYESLETELNDNQYAAIVSFVQNFSCSSLKRSTLLRKINLPDFDQVCPELKRWIHHYGEPLEGLKRRRNAECDLFHTPV
mmetsp:Transcript_8025/g.11948  ORF Transcript_8025/g.11948 Transcript_8025/m.11948 type:complete len:197 (-) Transcript_8025:3218-3808(-)